MQDAKENAIDRCSILVQPEEANDIMDELEIYMYAMKAEAEFAGELADTLAPLCCQIDNYNSPIAADHGRANAKFQNLISRIGAGTPKRLSELCGVDAQTCSIVIDNPVGCDADMRIAVVGGLQERSASVLWDTPSGEGHYSVGEMLYLWMRENFYTPFLYAQDAIAGRVKTKLVGAVGSLTVDELFALDGIDTVAALRDMASRAV